MLRSAGNRAPGVLHRTRTDLLFLGERTRLSGVFDAAEDRYSALTQDVFDDSLPEPRSIIVKNETVVLLVVAEFVQTIGIRKFTERAKLRRIEPVLEFVGDGHECHTRNYNIRAFK